MEPRPIVQVAPGQVWEVNRVRLRVLGLIDAREHGGFWNCEVVGETDPRRSTVRVHGQSLNDLGKLLPEEPGEPR